MNRSHANLIHPLAYGVLLGIYILVIANNVQVIWKARTA